ncbi:MAG: hypothetical protein ACC628_06275 [Pirellulaceae bacterium]
MLHHTRIACACSLVAALTCWWLAPVAAQDVRETSSLKFVSEDVAFYSTGLRLREQYDAFVGSKAFATLMEIPTIQLGMGMLQGMLQNPPNAQAKIAKEAFEKPENKELVATLVDAVSHEIFVYGSGDYTALLELANKMGQVQRSAQIAAIGSGSNPEEEAIRQIIAAVDASLDDLTIPDTVMGFKLTDADRAKAQLARLEAMAPLLSAQVPQLQGRINKEQIGESEFLTIQLDGSLVPWEDVLEDADEMRSELEPLIEKIKPMTLSISLGVWGDYFLISIGDTTEHLAALGQGALLANRPEMAPLANYATKPITEVNYVSEALMKEAGSVDRQIDEMLSMAEQLVPLAELDASLEQELVSDVKKFGEALKEHLPTPGAVASFAFLNGRGYEGYRYNYGENKTLDASQSLGILQHVGGSPILAVAGRSKYSLECYDGVVQWLGRGVYYAEKIGLPQMGDEERQLYETLRADLTPLVKQLGDITRDKMMPAMKDGQGAFVLDAGTTSDQWHQMMPRAETPVPVLEVGLVYGVSDIELLQQAAQEYFAVLQQILDKVHEAQPDQVPPIKLPPPESRDFPSGKVYYYRLPKPLGVDKHIAPCAAVANDTLALSLLPRQAARMLEPADLKAGAPLADPDRKMGAAVYFNFAGLVDAATPWVDYGMKIGFADADENWLATVMSQINTGLEVLKCFKGISAATYEEGGAWVTHIEATFQDLP